MRIMSRFLQLSVSSLMLLPLTGTSQNKSALKQQKISVTGKQSPVPFVKCTDPDTMEACKSFKQLVDVNDKEILDGLVSYSGATGKHTTLACFQSKSDKFSLVEFDIPSKFPYSKDMVIKEESDPAASSSTPVLFAGYSREDIEFFFVYEYPYTAFLRDNHPAYLELKDYFKQLHTGDIEFSPENVFIKSYENGIISGFVSDSGEWGRAVYGDGKQKTFGEPTFDGGRSLIEKHNQQAGVKVVVPDDLTKGHISIDGSNVYVHYSYLNRSDTTTDYLLTIHRSTGRFTETFKAPPSDPFSYSGTCMIFR